MRETFLLKHKDASPVALAYALQDCYETLNLGQYHPDSTYGRKLWAEIDVIRELQLKRKNHVHHP